ncbi:glycosyltransferase [uncultured Pseudokineococcus sp.]|uniref:glycosyltransferase n=1 Tax=uncultured Pseudokineococcus sp. TaxID=1642928 RepID=UPI002615AF3F|nr:glycosyltransferase [uncultured Pseudokineococcus sp.]
MTPARPLRVVHVITTLVTGGAERQLETLVARSGASTRTVALYGGGPVADSIRRDGGVVDVLGMDGWRKALAVPRLAVRLRRLRPDVVHVHLLSGQLWGIPAARLAGVPVVVSTEHSLMDGTIEGRPRSWWLGALYRLLERGTSVTVAVSATTAERLEGWGVPPDRVVVVENGIDFAALRPGAEARQRVRAELGVATDDLVLGLVGRLDPVKRVDEALRATAPRLRAGGAVMVVVGTGPLRNRLEALAGDLGVGGSVRFLGARGDVPDVLAAMDVLVSASRDETFGMAVVEALGSGLPVAYAQCPAVDEVGGAPAAHQVRSNGAMSTAEQHVEELAEALEGAVVDAAAPRRPAPDRLVERYGADSAAAAVDALYARLLAERVRGPRRSARGGRRAARG